MIASLAIAALVGGASLLWLFGAGRREGAPPGAAPPPPMPDVAAAPSATAEPAAAPLPPEKELPEPIRRYLQATVYPPTSGRLTPAHEDLLHPNRRHERPRPIPETLSDDPSQVVSSLLTADRYYYSGGETVHARLEAWQGEEPIVVRVVSARAVAEGRAGDEGEDVSVGFVRQGSRLVADVRLLPFADHLGPIRLEVRFEYAPGEEHEEAIRLFHTPASRTPARLTGQVRDSFQEGSLRIEVGVDVVQEGFYRFDANLYDAEGDPVAFAVFKGELPRGRTSVPLEVYGKVLRDAGVPGPYTVGEVRGYRFLDGQFPDRERLPDTETRWSTEAYPLDAFTDAPFEDEHKRRMVELMLEDVARGISLDAPGLPAPGNAVDERPPDDDAEVPVVTPSDPPSSR